MKKVLMIVCGAMLGIATMSQAQEVQDTASTDYNQGATEQTMDEPAVTDPTTQPTQDPTYAPTEEPALDQPTQDATSPTQDDATAPIQDDATAPTQDEATSPTLDQSGQDGNNQIRQEQSRESGLPTEDQTDQSTEGNDGSAIDDTHGPK